MRSWVRMRSESTVALGHPSETNPTLGTLFDMTGRASVMQLEKMAADYIAIFSFSPGLSGFRLAFFCSAVLTQISGIGRDLQLKFAVCRYGKTGAGGKGFEAVAAWQFHVQAAGYHMHDFQLGGAELVFAWSHHANGGGAVGHVEGDGFDGAVEVFVDLRHGGWLRGGRRLESMPKRSGAVTRSCSGWPT